MTDLILLATLALIVWATFYGGDIYDAQVALKHKASRDAITPELVDALIDAIYVEREHQARRSLMSIIEDREDVLADVDSILFERGEFPGSSTVINEADFSRLVRVIARVYEDCHYDITCTKTYMRASLAV
jgi:hypothetical protein